MKSIEKLFKKLQIITNIIHRNERWLKEDIYIICEVLQNMIDETKAHGLVIEKKKAVTDRNELEKQRKSREFRVKQAKEYARVMKERAKIAMKSAENIEQYEKQAERKEIKSMGKGIR